MPALDGIYTPEGRLYQPNPIQKLFHGSNAPYRFYGGAFGGGKTLCGSVESFLFSQYYPGSKGLVCRWSYTDLKTTTWETLLGVIPEGYLDLPHCNKSDFLLTFRNGSTIQGLNLQKEYKIRGRQAGWFYIDEITELPDPKMFMELVGRCRHGGSPNVGWGTGNANGHDWVYQLFHVQEQLEGKQSSDSDYAFFHCRTRDNKFNSPGYESRLRKLYPPDMVQKLLDGSFDIYEGMALYEWRADKHVLYHEDLEVLAAKRGWDSYPVYRGIDHGWKAPTCCLWMRVDADGNYFILDEYWMQQKAISDMCEDITRLTGVLPVIRTVVDKEVKKTNAQTGENSFDYYHRGLDYALLEVSDSAVLPSIATLQELLKIDKNHRHPVTGKMGSPRLFVSCRCPNLIREIPMLRWKGFGAAAAFKPTLVEGNDHAVSALRYLVQMRPATPRVDEGTNDYQRRMDHFYSLVQQGPPTTLANVIGNQDAY